MTGDKMIRRWPLFLIAAPAAVAVWSGWVGLGTLCGFGVIHPLPGIWDGLRLNTAITLPIGVEAYGAYALGAWLAPVDVPSATRPFSRPRPRPGLCPASGPSSPGTGTARTARWRSATSSPT